MMIPPSNSDDVFFHKLLLECEKSAPIGKGTSRYVYAIPFDGGKVLKVCMLPSNAVNWKEIAVYLMLDDAMKQYFGDVLSWSYSGKYLIMERLNNASPQQIKQFRAPQWWKDRKPSSIGVNQNNVVKIRDFGQVVIPAGQLIPPFA